MGTGEQRDGVPLTNLDERLFAGAGVTKRTLIDYLDVLSGPLITQLRDRPLSVMRVLRGQRPFMQKNLPQYTPPWVPRVRLWAQSSQRHITYALCNDRPTLLWLGNQRAVEYHPTLFRMDHAGEPTHLVLDIDPPEGDGFRLAVRAAHLVRQALGDAGLTGAVKTSGAKGVHVFVPVTGATTEQVAAATRALAARAERLDPDLATTAFVREDRAGKVFLDSTRAGGASVVAAYSPRLRPGLPVSFPVAWADLDDAAPGDFTVTTAPALLAGRDRWTESLPAPQRLPADLVDEGRAIPIARVQAMHEGKRRARARRESGAPTGPDVATPPRATFSPTITAFWDERFSGRDLRRGEGGFVLAVDPGLREDRRAMLLETADGGVSAVVTPALAATLHLERAPRLSEPVFRRMLREAGVTLHDAEWLFYFTEAEKDALLREGPSAAVRRLSADDGAVFADFRSAASEQDLDAAYVELDHWAVFGSFADGRLVSAASMYPWEGAAIADLGVLTLTPFRGQGHGRRLVRAICRHGLERGYEPQHRCRFDNRPSAALAAAAGLTRFGTWEVISADSTDRGGLPE